MAVDLADYFARTRRIENPKGDPNATSPTGAKGDFQFIPSTWRQYGRGDITDPAAQLDAMRRFTADNVRVLTAGLGREPTGPELYLAHQQGAGGALALLRNPGASPADLGLRRAVAVNGGDPSAPASAFVDKWKAKYLGGPVTPAAPRSAATPAAPSAVTPAASQGASALPSLAEAFAMAPAKPAAPIDPGSLAAEQVAPLTFAQPQKKQAQDELEARRRALITGQGLVSLYS